MYTDNPRPQIFTNYNLPFDLIELIFSFLSLEDNVRCLSVSKYWFHFIMDLPHFSNLCSNELPSLTNNKAAAMELLQQIVSSGSHFVVQSSSSSITTTAEQNTIVCSNTPNGVTKVDALKILNYTLKNNNQIKSLCLKDWLGKEGNFWDRFYVIRELISHPSISTYSWEWTTVESCRGWSAWTYSNNLSLHGPKFKSLTITVNERAHRDYKETGYYQISGSFPSTLQEQIRYEWFFYAGILPDIYAYLEYFKLSISTSSSITGIYPDFGAFGTFPSLIYLYLGAFNHMNPLLCARIASDHSPKLRDIIISPLAEIPREVRYDCSISEKAQMPSLSPPSTHNSEDDNGNNKNGLQCFVWTMGNVRPEDPKNFEWRCSVNTCPCYKRDVARIMVKHHQYLELLYLQFDGQHGIAFRSMRFLSNIKDYAKNLRELHLHATSSTLFGHFQCTGTEKRHYGSADNISQYLAQAIGHLPALEIIVLENEDCSSLVLTEQEKSSIVYMTIYDDVLQSLAINCTRLKEVIIWGPHMQVTASGVITFVLGTVSNQSLETIEIDCPFTDDQVAILLHRRSLMTKLKSLKVKDRSNLLLSSR